MKILICLVCILPLVSCGSKPPKPDTKAQKPNVRLAGRVHRVSDDFVLIRRYGRWSVEMGEVVESRAEGRQANLLPTGERLGEHIAADIRQGTVEVGDAVYIRRITKAKDTKPSPTPEKPAAADNQPRPE